MLANCELTPPLSVAGSDWRGVEDIAGYIPAISIRLMLRPAAQEHYACARNYGDQQKPNQPSACHTDAATHSSAQQPHVDETDDSNHPCRRQRNQRNQHNIPYFICHNLAILAWTTTC